MIDRSKAWDDAWDQCFSYFGKRISEFDPEIGSLRLAYYLACFGMFRGSSKLSTLPLSEYRSIVEICRTHWDLRGNSPSDYAKNIDQVIDFTGKLTDNLSYMGIATTPTLVSKIALGTTACMPAYDRFAKAALGKLNIIARPSRQGLTQLYEREEAGWETLDLKVCSKIPFMRSLDKALMQKGMEIKE